MRKLLESKKLHAALGLLVSLALIVWIAQEVDWKLVIAESKKISPWGIIPLTASLFLHFYLRALRWRYLLPHQGEIPTKLLLDSIMIGNLATFLLPLRAGEFIRPFILSKESHKAVPYSVSFTSVVIERFFDLMIVLCSFGIVLLFIPTVPAWVNKGAYILSLMGGGILLFIITAISVPSICTNLLTFVLNPCPRLLSNFALKITQDFISGAAVLKSPKNLTMTFLLSVAVWLSNYLFIYVSIGIFDMPNSILLATTVAVIIALAVAAPSAPGFIGVIQISCIVSFALFGFSKELATAYAVVQHSFLYLFICSYGFYALASRNLSLTKLKDSADTQSS